MPNDSLPPDDASDEAFSLSRRSFLAGTSAVGVALFASQLVTPLQESFGAEDAGEGKKTAPPTGAETVPLTLRINGQEHQMQIDPRVTLLDALRERLQLTGTKKGCDHGQCGSCTVLANGRRINACLALALSYEGDEITTIEGLAKGDELHPVQAAFIKHDGFQCGYCTPGQICSAVACIDEGHAGSDAEVREWMSGNLCRCGAYNGIVAAVREANGQIKKAPAAVS